MKQFFRKLPGKVMLYIVHLLCVGCFIGAVVGAGLMAEAGVYTYEKEEVFDTLAKQMMGADVVDVLKTYWRTTDTPLQISTKGNLRFWFYDSEDKLLAKSEESPDPDKDLAGATLYYEFTPVEGVAAEEAVAESEASEASETVESEIVGSEVVESEVTESEITEMGSEAAESEVAESEVMESEAVGSEAEPSVTDEAALAPSAGTDESFDSNIVSRYKQLTLMGEDFIVRNSNGKAAPFHAECWLKNGLPKKDKYHALQTVLDIAYALRYSIYLLALLFIVCGIASFVALMSVSGRRAGDDGLYPGGFYRVPVDLLLCVVLGIGCIPFGVGLDQLDTVHSVGTGLIWGCVVVFDLWGFYGICVGCCMSIAVRVKGHTLWKNTLIYRGLALCVRLVKGCFSLCGKVCRKFMSYAKHVHSLSKFIIGYICMILLEIVLFALELYPVFVVVTHLAVILLFVYVAYMVHVLRQAAKALADGELNRQVDTSKLRGLCREHAEDLNHIAEGMTIAVEERLKSERMKTELITNVSHDIKTPLTSIINYASLISAEPCENAHITEYAKVLVRQSDRLKRLIEDLVEASKASTGNLEVHLSPCNAGIFIEQAAGEYEEKLEKAGLTLVTSKPETEVRIMADGRRMWRVFDNLMNNICKYALSGTRVYLMLEEKGGQAYFSFKNISRDSLNVSTEELMERFVRGDASRNTEGNGLGLSIAQSMAQLQGGELTLSVDGDLFKAVLQFPVITGEEKTLPHTVDGV